MQHEIPKLLTSCPCTPGDLWDTFQSFVCRMTLICSVTQSSDNAVCSLFQAKQHENCLI